MGRGHPHLFTFLAAPAEVAPRPPRQRWETHSAHAPSLPFLKRSVSAVRAMPSFRTVFLRARIELSAVW